MSNTPIDKTSCDELHSSKLQRVETGRVDVSSFDMARDPGLRKPIWMYDVNQQDEARRAYIDMGPCQPKLDEYEKIWDGNQFHHFQYPWFAQFSWLEYSVAKNKVFCFPCFLFDRNSSKFKVFTVDGFDNWKRVNNGKLCKFKHHEREDNSLQTECAKVGQFEMSFSTS